MYLERDLHLLSHFSSSELLLEEEELEGHFSLELEELDEDEDGLQQEQELVEELELVQELVLDDSDWQHSEHSHSDEAEEDVHEDEDEELVHDGQEQTSEWHDVFLEVVDFRVQDFGQ